MKNLKGDLPKIIGLIGTASLACVSGGIAIPAINGLMGLVGSLSSGVASNIITELTPGKLKKWFVDVHPNDLNHSIKKLFISSIQEALSNINILYSESGATKQEKQYTKKIITLLSKELPEQLENTSLIQFGDAEVEKILNASSNADDDIVSFILQKIEGFELSLSFKQFFSQHLVPQVQLCFGEGLKNPANSEAWIAFQQIGRAHV